MRLSIADFFKRRSSSPASDAASSALNDALPTSPRPAEALKLHGNVLREQGRLEQALICYEQALVLEPDYVAALYNRGNTLLALKRPQDALASFDRVLALDAQDAEALSDRGNALLDLKRPDDALASYDRALMQRPDYVPALYNRGNVLLVLKRTEEALASYDRALAVDPHCAEALGNRGLALHDLGRYDEALESYSRALDVDRDCAEALFNRGSTLAYLGRHDEALADLERAVAIDPDLKFGQAMLLNCRKCCCDWSAFEAQSSDFLARVRRNEVLAHPFFFLGMSDSAADQLHCARAWVKDECPASAAPLWQGERYRHDRIRVAYLSSDFRDHAVMFLMAGLFERHDRSRFETIAISFGPDSATEAGIRLKRTFDRFIDVRKSDDREVGQLLRDLEVDIAVDLNGFTINGRTRILAARAAPIQVNYLGFPGTMGAQYIDYIIADGFVIPAEQHRHYAEKIVNLPDSFQVNDDKRRIAERTPTRAELGLPAQGLVFCSFNNNYKITPRMFDIWMRLLSEVEGSVLWLLGDKSAIEGNLRREAAARGVAAERLVFARRLGYADYLARYRVADLFLDTLPFNAGTTASDALWAGLPVLTCAGEVFAGRMAGSLLRAVGVPELITHSLAEYEEVALTLARDPARLTAIRQKLARNRDTFPLFDTDRFRRHIEAAYVAMWERHQRGEPPANIDVATVET